MEEFKTALLEIMKQDEQWRCFEQRLEKFKELLVEQQ